MRISDWSSDVCSSDLGPGCLHHGALEPPLCREDARRVDEDDLRVAMDRNAADPSSRGLHLVRDDRDLGAHEMIHQSRLAGVRRSEEHTSELQSLMRISYDVFCLKKKTQNIKVP